MQAPVGPAVPARGAVIPISFGEPPVQTFMHEVAGARGGIRVQDVRVKENTGQIDFVVAGPMVRKVAEYIGRIGDVIICLILIVTVVTLS